MITNQGNFLYKKLVKIFNLRGNALNVKKKSYEELTYLKISIIFYFIYKLFTLF